MDQEPHHHLIIHNDYVRVFDVRSSPGDSIAPRGYYQDTLAVVIDDQPVSAGPGKADGHQNNGDGQVQFQRPGYVPPTRIDTPYHAMAVELMHSQTNFHNVCAPVLPNQPLNCPSQVDYQSPVYSRRLLIASNETEVALLRIHPHQTMKMLFAVGSSPQLLIALDAASLPRAHDAWTELLSLPGALDWNEYGAFTDFRNDNDGDRRFIEVIFQRAH